LPITRRMRSGPLRVGQDFGARYHVLRLLGAGGMGVVYQALDRDLGVEVALKVLRSPPTSARTLPAVAELQRRFKTELLLARQITHKNVIRIHDIGEIGGIRFISMPYIKGGDLATILKRGPLPAAAALRYARHLAAGLIAVHGAGVIHRDLKPANIMIGDKDQALLMDFGIARSSSSSQRTIAGAVVGTLAYMAPEQARGTPVDARSDIYAFGLILHEMLAGPRTNVTMADVLGRMKAPPPSPRSLNPRVPHALDAIVTRCLQPDPAARFQSSLDLASALAGLSRRGRGHAPGMPRSSGAWLPRVAAALLVFALAGGAYWMVKEGVVAATGHTLSRLARSLGSQVERAVRADSPPAHALAEPVTYRVPEAAVLRTAAPAASLATVSRPWSWLTTKYLVLGRAQQLERYAQAPSEFQICYAPPRADDRP
jgi:eukaryotic-like serine/threonine-protein kinase